MMMIIMMMTMMVMMMYWTWLREDEHGVQHYCFAGPGTSIKQINRIINTKYTTKIVSKIHFCYCLVTVQLVILSFFCTWALVASTPCNFVHYTFFSILLLIFLFCSSSVNTSVKWKRTKDWTKEWREMYWANNNKKKELRYCEKNCFNYWNTLTTTDMWL